MGTPRRRGPDLLMIQTAGTAGIGQPSGEGVALPVGAYNPHLRGGTHTIGPAKRAGKWERAEKDRRLSATALPAL